MKTEYKYKFELTPALSKYIDSDKEEDIASETGFARRFLNLLVAKIEDDLEYHIRKSEDIVNYESDNWHCLQADNLGYRRALRDVINAIGPKQGGEEND